jgi:hypothetical protein
MTSADGPSGFWSYVHKDNDQGGGRILRLAQRISDEFAMLTGQDLEVFVDRESLAWGDEWRLRINVALQETTFFIPVVTPRYFNSEECRNELLKFAAHARSLGADDLLLPILYVDVDGLTEDSGDEARALIAKTQYADWRHLRLVDESSEEYARGVNKLALRLAEISKEYANRPSVVPTEVASNSALGADDEPGVADLIAQLEEAMPQWNDTIHAFPAQMMEITAITERATERLHQGDAQGKGFAFRVLVARDMAAEMADSAKEMERLGEDYASQLLAMDPGVRALISAAGEPDRTDEDKVAACEMFESLKELVSVSRENSRSVKGFADSLKGPAKQFRDLRPALSMIDAGLRSVLDAQTILEEWGRLMEESPLDCGEVGTPSA